MFSVLGVPYIFLGYICEHILDMILIPFGDFILNDFQNFALNDTNKSWGVFVLAYFFIINLLIVFKYLKKNENSPQNGFGRIICLLITMLCSPFIAYGILNWVIYVSFSWLVFKGA
jgi:hypothetical protein